MGFSKRAFETYKNLQSIINAFDEDTKLVFVRHGQTDNNLHRIAQGRRCAAVPLNTVGLAQAKSTASHLSNMDFDLSFCSPAKRAKQTFEKIRELNPIRPTLQFELENLHEIDWGADIDGKPMHETKYQELNDTWFNYELQYEATVADSENLDDVFERAVNALSEILIVVKDLQKENKLHEAPTILVCGHGFMFGLLLTMIANAQYGLSKKPETGKATLLTITKAQNIITNL